MCPGVMAEGRLVPPTPQPGATVSPSSRKVIPASDQRHQRCSRNASRVLLSRCGGTRAPLFQLVELHRPNRSRRALGKAYAAGARSPKMWIGMHMGQHAPVSRREGPRCPARPSRSTAAPCPPHWPSTPKPASTSNRLAAGLHQLGHEGSMLEPGPRRTRSRAAEGLQLLARDLSRADARTHRCNASRVHPAVEHRGQPAAIAQMEPAGSSARI